MMMPGSGAAYTTAGSIWEELASAAGREERGGSAMRVLLVRSVRHSKAKFLLLMALWIPFILVAMLVQSPPLQGGCEVPGTGSCPETDRELGEAPERPGPGSRSRQAGQRIMDPGFLEAVSGHFRSVFGEQVTAAEAYLTRDFLLIRTRGLLVQAERGLLEAGADGDSDFIRTMKLKLAESSLAVLASGISRATGLRFDDSYLSYSPHDDELMVMLTLPGEGKG